MRHVIYLTRAEVADAVSTYIRAYAPTLDTARLVGATHATMGQGGKEDSYIQVIMDDVE